MATRKLSAEEVLLIAREQIDALSSSSISLFKGRAFEAKRIASALRTLCHQTHQSTPLIAQLRAISPRVKEILLFDKRGIEHYPWIDNTTLYLECQVSMMNPSGESSEGEFKERFGFKHTLDQWWQRTIWADGTTRWSRRDVALVLSNKLGGAHVDAEIDEAKFRFLHSWHIEPEFPCCGCRAESRGRTT